MSPTGVAFSKNVSSSTDNIGYIIPHCIVQHFLSEYASAGVYRGICCPGFYTQPMENPAQQQYLKVWRWLLLGRQAGVVTGVGGAKGRREAYALV